MNYGPFNNTHTHTHCAAQRLWLAAFHPSVYNYFIIYLRYTPTYRMVEKRVRKKKERVMNIFLLMRRNMCIRMYITVVIKSTGMAYRSSDGFELEYNH